MSKGSERFSRASGPTDRMTGESAYSYGEANGATVRVSGNTSAISATADEKYKALIDEEVDVSGLTQEQQTAIKDLLWQERDVVTMDSDDIGCAEEL